MVRGGGGHQVVIRNKYVFTMAYRLLGYDNWKCENFLSLEIIQFGLLYSRHQSNALSIGEGS